MRNILDYAIIGRGIGGVASALALRDFHTHLFEKEPYLGGCASSFARGKYIYNIGATTFATYQKSLPLYNFFEKNSITLNLKKIDPAISVKIGSKNIHRYRDIDRFIDEVNRKFAYSKNREFWYLIKNISDRFYGELNIYYSKASFKDSIKSISSLSKIFLKFPKEFLQNAKGVIENFFPNIDREYLEFLDNQILIVAQTKSDSVNFLVASLALSYTFYDNFYSFGGMRDIFTQITKDLKNIHLKEEVKEIEILKSSFLIRSNRGEYESKRVILNSTIFDSYKLFKDSKIQNYYKKLENLNSNSSAFVIYLTLESKREFNHHYQLIQEKNFNFSISNSIFVSFSDIDDHIVAPKGEYSITISTHTLSTFWQNLSKDEYKKQKKLVQDEIMNLFFKHFSDVKIIDIFSATPKTFNRYINRATLGGVANSYKNMFFKLAPPTTDIKNLYQIGDTTFPGQGFAGVTMGVENLMRIIHGL